MVSLELFFDAIPREIDDLAVSSRQELKMIIIQPKIIVEHKVFSLNVLVTKGFGISIVNFDIVIGVIP